MLALPNIAERLPLAIQRVWHALVLSFCMVCAILPTNMAGPFGVFAVAEAEGEATSETEEACWGVTFRQLTRRVLHVPAPAARLVETAARSTLNRTDYHPPHRGELSDLNGCGAPLLL